MRLAKVSFIATVLLCGCATEAELQQQVDECVANSRLEPREGESLDSDFQRRATLAHCRKIVLGEVN